jgi:hypothetical protein
MRSTETTLPSTAPYREPYEEQVGTGSFDRGNWPDSPRRAVFLPSLAVRQSFPYLLRPQPPKCPYHIEQGQQIRLCFALSFEENEDMCKKRFGAGNSVRAPRIEFHPHNLFKNSPWICFLYFVGAGALLYSL